MGPQTVLGQGRLNAPVVVLGVLLHLKQAEPQHHSLWEQTSAQHYVRAKGHCQILCIERYLRVH